MPVRTAAVIDVDDSLLAILWTAHTIASTEYVGSMPAARLTHEKVVSRDYFCWQLHFTLSLYVGATQIDNFWSALG
jgi:hypothetical protein